MKKLLYSLFVVVALCSWAEADMEGGMIKNIHWLGHDTFKITGDTLIFTDPFQIKPEHITEKADLILITHEHRDHCSSEDVNKIVGENTVIIATEDCAKKLSHPITSIKPGDKLAVKNITIEAVPAYNTNKKFHPKENNWVGYIFTVEGTRIYLAGDTDHIPEMKNYNCDVALIPVSGTYVMTADEAVAATLDINPELAIPMHYGAIVGEPKDAEIYARALKGKIEVRILEEE